RRKPPPPIHTANQLPPHNRRPTSIGTRQPPKLTRFPATSTRSNHASTVSGTASLFLRPPKNAWSQCHETICAIRDERTFRVLGCNRNSPNRTHRPESRFRPRDCAALAGQGSSLCRFARAGQGRLVAVAGGDGS